MAVTAYTGVPGSGKSHALVGEVIIPALIAGRRVLSNVDGLKPDKIADYVSSRSESPGELVLFRGEATTQPGFFPQEETDTDSTFLRPGDLMVMDEVRLYWPSRGKFPEPIMKFLRFHRHWVAQDGTSTDVVVCSQLMTDFHADFRGLVERSLKFKKLNSLGLSKVYSWSQWEGARQVKSEVISSGTGKYRPEIFELYSSYKGGAQGQEKATDKRAFALGGTKIKLALAIMVLGILGGSWVIWKFFHPADLEAADQAEQPTTQSEARAADAAQENVKTDPAVLRTPPPPPPPVVSSDWRIAGYIDAGQRWVILADRAGVVRLEHPSGFTWIDGQPISGMVRGEIILAGSVQPAQAPRNEKGLFGQ